LISIADVAKAKVDSIFINGAGSLLTGFLSLEDDKVQGFGTTGESAKASVVNYSTDHSTAES